MNPFVAFQALLKKPKVQIGTVTAVSGTTVTVTLPDGGVLSVRGSATVGSKVFVRDGVIEGPAPSLSTYSIEV